MTASRSSLPEEFVNLQEAVPTLEISPRYATPFNFTGRIVAGYQAAKVVLTRQAAEALGRVQEEALNRGFSLVVYDGYRPQKAVMDFVRWFSEPDILDHQRVYYPFCAKADLVSDGYISKTSSHTRGSTVDLTLKRLGTPLRLPQDWILRSLRLKDDRQIPVQEDGTLPMGGHFDLFDISSHGTSCLLGEDMKNNRKMLADLMMDKGFEPYEKEWWHFRFSREPFPYHGFDFDIL